jgi:Cu-Zn family superoxide dismutase
MNAVAYFDPLCNHGVHGTVYFSQESPKTHVEVSISLQGFKAHQVHAIHIHEYGDLTHGCKSTGNHLNPYGDTHGSPFFTATRHAGDLVNNLFTDEKGCARITFLDDNLSLNPGKPECILGRAVVIHQQADDYGLGGLMMDHGKSAGAVVPYKDMPLETLRRLCKERKYPFSGSKQSLIQKLETESKTTGNAGGRMACAVIGLASPVLG